jgi:hypothetical protein
VGFSVETLQARREWHDMFKVLTGKNCQQEYYTHQGYPSEGGKTNLSQTGKN